MPNRYLEIAIETALEAGKILRDEFDRPPDIAYKGDADLVTQADRRSEQAIVARLTKYFPDHSISAEEGTGHKRNSEFHRHVDPLDGTTNFAHKYPCFSVSIALCQTVSKAAHQAPHQTLSPNETLLAGVVYNPIYNELFAAARGEGATRNGTKISVSRVSTLATSLLCTGFPVHKRLANPNIHYYYDFTLRSHGVRRDGSAALDLACVAAGRFDGFWEFGLKPWDTAAGVLLVQEAGGTVSEFSGNPYTLGGPMVLATNSLIHEEMRKVALAISQRDPAEPLRPPT
jgi:myo-inositol-1(or 4)-monophosphatase